MYRIIGVDQKEYGPITFEQMRDWIAQGRANGATLVQTDTSGGWKPLINFPELAAMLSTEPAAPPPIAAGLDLRKSKLVAGLLGIFLGGLGIHRFYLGYTMIGVVQIIVTICTLGAGYIWGFVEGILIIAGVAITTDATGAPLRE